MNVLVLHGSARKGGDTDALAESFLGGMAEIGSQVVRHFFAIDMKVAHCRGAECLACCADGQAGRCVVEDDMQPLYPALRDANVVVLATPMFWGYMTSQLKTVFDRLEAVASPTYFGGKDFVLLVGYRRYYGSMVEWLGRIARGFGSRFHFLVCQTYDPATDRDVPIRETPHRLAEARDLGRRVAAACGGGSDA
ncbi:MAG: flavodoxin family protein [Candidatus Bipolaricaulota bacterium]